MSHAEPISIVAHVEDALVRAPDAALCEAKRCGKKTMAVGS